MGALPDPDPVEELSGAGVEYVHRLAVAAGEPELRAVARHAAHVRAAAELPGGGDRAGGGVDDRDGPVEPVGGVEDGGVPAGVEAVGALAGRDELGLLQLGQVDDRHAVALLVGHQEHRTVGGEAHVDRRPADVDGAGELHLREVEPHQVTVELARQQHLLAVGGEVAVVDAVAGGRDAALQRPGVGVAEVEAVEAFGHDDGVRAVGREVQVVGVVDRDRLARLAGERVDRSQRVAVVVGDVERLEVPGRGDVLGDLVDGEVVDDLERDRVDDVDVVALAVGDVDAGRDSGHRRAQVVDAGVGVDPGDGGRQHPRRRPGRRRVLRVGGARTRPPAGAGGEGDEGSGQQQPDRWRRATHRSTPYAWPGRSLRHRRRSLSVG